MTEQTPREETASEHDAIVHNAPEHDHEAQEQDEERTTRTVTEEFKISGEAVVGKVKELVREGNVRRIIVANEEGRTLLEIPLTIGVIGTVLLPVWAAIGAVAALAANLTLRVERRVPADEAADEAEDAVEPHGKAAGETHEG